MTEAARDRLAQIRLKAAAIIPAYREEKHVGDVVRRTRQQLDHVLVVDDGSNDKTAQQVLDADGQHLPEEIDRFMAAAASSAGPSFFLGNRMNNLIGMPLIRRVVNRYMSKRISRFCGQKISDTQCGFRMLDRQLIPELLGGANRFDYETEMLIIASRKGYRIESVPITTVYSDEVSNIQPVRDALRFFKLMRRYRKGRGD